MLNIISLGAGVQSSTMALMAAHGEITPMPDCAIFADTQNESQATYRFLAYLEKLLPFPVHRVTASNLLKIIGQKRKNGRYRKVKIPAFIDGKSPGKMAQSCTGDFKKTPIKKKVREIAGLFKKRSPASPIVTQWLGISVDEADRMKPSGENWRMNRYPLIELNLRRQDCLQWMQQHSYNAPPKSACVFCPYQSQARWGSLSDVDWKLAIIADEKLREHPSPEYCDNGPLFLHREMLPLTYLRPFLTHPSLFDDKDGFSNECEGMCGV